MLLKFGVEDQSATKTSFYRVGDSIARGRIRNITLDHIDYEHATRVQRVEIGQNLLGELARVSVPASPVASPNVGVGASPPGASPAGAAAPAASPPVSEAEASTIERLKKRHAAGQ